MHLQVWYHHGWAAASSEWVQVFLRWETNPSTTCLMARRSCTSLTWRTVRWPTTGSKNVTPYLSSHLKGERCWITIKTWPRPDAWMHYGIITKWANWERSHLQNICHVQNRPQFNRNVNEGTQLRCSSLAEFLVNLNWIWGIDFASVQFWLSHSIITFANPDDPIRKQNCCCSVWLRERAASKFIQRNVGKEKNNWVTDPEQPKATKIFPLQ